MKKKRSKWSVGDVFAVRTLDGKYALGQIVGREADVLNSVSVALFDRRIDRLDEIVHAELPYSAIMSVLFTTRDLLDSGDWTVIDKRPVTVPADMLPYEHLRASGFVGANIEGSGIVVEFLNAFYGLTPWDDWADPTYLDELLISPDKKPRKLMLVKKSE